MLELYSSHKVDLSKFQWQIRIVGGAVELDTMIGLARDGMTMICVAHEMGFARQVADRVIFMADGQIVEEAEPNTFFRDPQHPRTRAFLGEILAHH